MTKLAHLRLRLTPRAGSQPGPTDVVRTTVGRVFERPARGRAVADQQQGAIHEIADNLFDVPAMAQQCLARHWMERSPGERQEFVQLLKGLLARAYVNQLKSYAGGRIDYTSETVDGQLATVRCKVTISQRRDIAISYRLHRVGARWAVYDVSIDGASFLVSYRDRLHRMIDSSSYADLIWRMRLKDVETAAAQPA